MKHKPVKQKKKKAVNFSSGLVYVKSTFNNTIVTITDPVGNTLTWATAGSVKFNGARKSLALAGGVAAKKAAEKAKSYGIKSVEVYLKGPGAGREPAVRALVAEGLQVTQIRDITPVAHNGCRPKKRRRV